MSEVYRHDYDENAVYGHVVSLLRDYVSEVGVLLDFGCGFGSIAEPVRDQLGLTYIGLDQASDGLEDLQKRGFEAHSIDLSDVDAAETAVGKILAGRSLAGISFIDTLEHLVPGLEVLSMMRRLAGARACPLVVSVPNVAHHHIAAKLMLGRWEMTESGLLDHTHVRFYTAGRLNLFMTAAGWAEAGDYDFRLEASDQQFPADALPLLHTAPLGHFLRRLVDRAHPHATVNQFVRAYLPAEPRAIQLLADRSLSDSSFLTVVLKAGTGADIDRLRDIFAALATQTCQDFEVRFVLYKSLNQAPFRALISKLPAAFRRRITLIRCDQGGPAEAYNVGLEKLESRYAAFLDDSSLPLDNWIDTFREMAQSGSGNLLQTRSRMSASDGARPPDLVDMFFGVEAPLPALAFPRSLWRDMGLRFDASLPTDEDRDFIAGAAQVCAVVDRDSVTVVIHPAPNARRDEDRNIAHARLLRRLNGEEILTPSGAALRIAELMRERGRLAEIESAAQNLLGGVEALPPQSASTLDRIGSLITERHELHRRIEALGSEIKALSEAFGGEIKTLSSEIDRLREVPENPLLPLLTNLAAYNQHESVVAQLARAYAPAAIIPAPPPPETFLLSIITRTQGLRVDSLSDVLLCLAGQSCQDFEVIIVLHKCDDPLPVRNLVKSFPSSLSQRITLTECNTGGRATPLNHGLGFATGSHTAFLDDDDFVFGHWVETFKGMAETHPGKMLRTVCARQDTERGSGSFAKNYPSATSWFDPYPAEYDLLTHLSANHTPFMALAFPAFTFRNLGLRFDESLSTTEDWELTVRAVLLLGIHTKDETTSVYRWWVNARSSATEHGQDEWEANRQEILDKANTRPLLLPPGSFKQIARLVDDGRQLAVELAAAKDQQAVLQTDIERGAALLRHQAVAIMTSRSWRISRPLRRMSRGARLSQDAEATSGALPVALIDLADLVQNLRLSRSWRFTAPLRLVGWLFRPLRRRR